MLEKLNTWLVATGGAEPPGSDLAKAAAYCLNHWTALTRFVEDGRVGLDNNICYAASGMPRPGLCRVGERTRSAVRDLDCAALVDAA